MADSNLPSTRKITLNSVPIELSALLKFTGIAESGGDAKQMIRQGLVLVNGAVETRKGKKLGVGDRVTVAGETLVIEVA
ncbi:RNA-binding S4 domain-containing protein [Verrucomicrobiota bacterium sgz303538]